MRSLKVRFCFLLLLLISSITSCIELDLGITDEELTQAKLGNIELTNATLDTSFNEDDASYTATLNSNSDTEVTISLEKLSDAQVISINGKYQATATINVTGEMSTVTIEVTAPDGETKFKYTIKIYRKVEPSNNAFLKSLSIDGVNLNPVFSKITYSYSAAVDSSVNSVELNFEKDVSGSVVKVNNKLNDSGSEIIQLNDGTTDIFVDVTSADSLLTRSYKISISKGSVVNTYLSSLGVSTGSLSPAFQMDVTNYTMLINSSSVSFTPVAVSSGATITVDGQPVQSGSTSQAISVASGSTYIVLITVSDSQSTFTYSVSVSRDLAKVATPSFSLSNGEYETGQQVSISSSTIGSTIYYTLDGTSPNANSIEYTGAIEMNEEKTYTFKAIAIKSGMYDSSIAAATYVVSSGEVEKVSDPMIYATGQSPYTVETKFSVACATSNANIEYKVDSGSWKNYSNEFNLTAVGTYTIYARASKSGLLDSNEVTKTVTIENVEEKDFTIHYKKPSSWAGAYVHYWQDPANPITDWFGGAKEMTDEGNGWYSFTFNDSDLVNDKISFLFKPAAGDPGGVQSADFTGRSKSDDSWFDGTNWYAANPDAPSKPVIKVSHAGGIVNGEQVVTVTVTAVNASVDSKSVTFNGSTVNMTGESIDLKISDYIENGNSGILSVSASNSVGASSSEVSFVRNDEVETSGIKIYIEADSGPLFYAWIVENGNPKDLNGGWPGKNLTETEMHTGHKWYVFDYGDVDTALFILDGQGGSDQSKSKTSWLAKDGKWYDVDPYKPTAPMVSVSPGTGIYKGKKKVTITVTARNATVDSKSATVNGNVLNLTGETTEYVLSDIIGNKQKATIVVTASNSLGSDSKTVELNRDDDYEIPTGEFTWDNALVYFVMTDRFYNGDTSNDHSYDRKTFESEQDPLNVATFHGGDLVGMTEKIEDGYFDELGVNAIWVTAPYEQIHGWVGGGSGDFPHYAYHGYYALDWTMMDRNMGTVEEMRTFVDTAHEHNIRVVLDIVINHVGYNTVQDMYDYGFASYNQDIISSRDWMHPLAPQNWQSHHGDKEGGSIFYKSEQMNGSATPIGDWLNWWGPDWVRAGIEGYDEGDGSDYQNPLSGLPDIKTEATTATSMPPILKTKWGMESSSSYDPWIVPGLRAKRNANASVVPGDFVIDCIAGWVEEFGIDGFRCDTAKHVKLNRWKQLKEKSDAALKRWRANNPSKPGADWDEDFWMTGEVWDHGVNKDGYFTSGGFDSIINFTFPHKNGGGNYIPTWKGYADAINSDPEFNVLHYVNSHDQASKSGVFGKGASCIPAGTALVLSPGGVQIFYGDENDRPNGPSCSDMDHSSRSDYLWGTEEVKLAHWQKVGRFRNMNPAVGAGAQTEIDANTFSRAWNDNKVVIRINATGSTEVSVGTAFANGTKVRNAYNGETSVVDNGSVTFTGENGIILIEEIK